VLRETKWSIDAPVIRMATGTTKSYPCPQCGQQRHVPLASLNAGAIESTCPHCSKTVALEDRDGVLFVDGAPVEEAAARPSSSAPVAAAPQPPGAARKDGAPLPPGASRGAPMPPGGARGAGAPLPPGGKRPAASATVTPKAKKAGAGKSAAESAAAQAASDAAAKGKEAAAAAAQVVAPPSDLSGSLETLPVADALMILLDRKKAGCFVVRGEGCVAKIFIKNGVIMGCRHPLAGTTVGSLLMERGLVEQPQLEAAFSAMAQAEAARVASAAADGQEAAAAPSTPRKLLLATLVEMGALPESAVRGIVEQFVDITVAQALGWSKGTFTFESSDGTLSDADLKDPQVGFAGIAFEPPERLATASRFARALAEAAASAAALALAKSAASSAAAAAAAAAATPAPVVAPPRASRTLAWLALPGLLLGLGAAGAVAYRIEKQKVACAGELKAVLAKPVVCPPVVPCPATVTPPDGAAAADEGDEAADAGADLHKGKRGGAKGKGAKAKRAKAKGKSKSSGDPRAPSIDDLMEPEK